MVRTVGHVRDEHGATHPAAHGTRVVQHLVHGDGQRTFEPHHDHGERVAHQQQVDASLIGQPCGGVVVGGQRRNGLMCLLAFQKCVGSDLCGWGRDGGQTHDLPPVQLPAGDAACVPFQSIRLCRCSGARIATLHTMLASSSSVNAAWIAASACAAALAVGGFHYAALWPASRIFGRSLIAGKDPAEVALTYDDGPNDPYTGQLMDVLARNQIRATFFVIGRYVRQKPHLARALHEAGHLIGCHTMTHPRLMYMGPKRIRAEIADATALIEDTIGSRVRFFRPPFGARNPAVFRVAAELQPDACAVECDFVGLEGKVCGGD